jgi:ABC-type arginine/histidine transport system permease subunit
MSLEEHLYWFKFSSFTFGLGQIEYLRSTFLWVILKEPYWCAIIAFTLNTGAYTSRY